MASVVLHAFEQFKQSGQIKLFKSHRPDYDDGMQLRDFIYVKDVVRANILASEKGNETYNVALGHSTSILELAQKIIEITNSKSEVQFLEERAGDIKHSRANTSKFNELGFTPKYTISQALLETITFYENELLVN